MPPRVSEPGIKAGIKGRKFTRRNCLEVGVPGCGVHATGEGNLLVPLRPRLVKKPAGLEASFDDG